MVRSRASSERVRKQLEKRLAEKIRKLLLLCAQFGIDINNPQRWLLLSLALAEKHERGFQEVRKPGAKRRWTVFDRFDLKTAVDDLIERADKDHKKGVKWACEVLAKRDPWKTRLMNNEQPVEVLRHAYYDARRYTKETEQRSVPTRK